MSGEEAGSGFAVTGGYSAILLAFGEEILNQMAGLVEVFVVIALNLPVRFGLDDGGLSGLLKRRVLSSKPVGGKWPDAILLWDAKCRQWLMYTENN